MISIIIVNYNGWRDTIECLESILRSDYFDYRIIIVDNASINNSMEYIKMWADGKLNCWVSEDNPLRDKSFPPCDKPQKYCEYIYDNRDFKKMSGDGYERIVLINSTINTGFTGGNNIGLIFSQKFVDCTNVWFLNNDTVISKTTLKNLVRLSLKGKYIIGANVLYYYKPNIIQVLGGTKKFNFIPNNKNNYIYGNFDRNDVVLNTIEPIEGYVYGASMFVPIQIIDKIGLFDENYFMWYDEFDFCYRAKLAGFKFYAEPDSIVWHKEGGATKDHDLIKKDSESLKRFVVYGYYGTRNCLYLNKKYFNVFKFYFCVVPVLLFFLAKGCFRVIVKFRRDRLKRIGFLLLGFRDGIFGKMGVTIDISSVK